ncbi:MAG: lantibiotic dehydratase [Burkholderiales bacterium]|nr:lantibiotic dehydratase [Burkholderiales bacterium]
MSPQDDTRTETPWKLFKHGVCYEGGFPFEWVDRVYSAELDDCCKECARAEKALMQAERALTTAAEELLTSGTLEPGAKKAADRVLHAIRRRRFPERETLVNAQLAAPAADHAQRMHEFDAATRRLESVFTQARREANAALLALQKAPVVRDSILTTSPHFFSTGFDKLHDAHGQESDLARLPRSTRRRLAKLYMYLQRGATKTHVASQLGMVGFVTADPDSSRAVELDRVGVFPKTHVFVSFWAVAALSKFAFSVPLLARELVPAVLGCITADDDGGFRNLLSGERHVLSPGQRRLLNAVDGERSAFQLASALDMDIDEMLTSLRTLAQYDLIDAGDTPPVTEHDPIQWLVARLERCQRGAERDRWLHDVASIRTLATQIEGAVELDRKSALIQQMEQAFALAVARSPRRNAGQTYGDRLVFYEERMSDFRCSLGAPVIGRLQEQVGAALDVCWAYGTLWQRHYQEMSSAAFKTAAGGLSSLPFITFVAQLQSMANEGRLTLEDPGIHDFERRWSELVESRRDGSGHVSRLSRVDVASFIDGFELGREGPLPSAHAGIDIFIEAADLQAIDSGNYRIAIGEVGENIMGWGSQFYFHPDSAAVTRDLDAVLRAIPDYRRMAMILPPRNHKGLIHQSFTTSGRFVFARARSSRPSDDVPLRDLMVFDEGGRLSIGTASGERFQMFHHHDELAHLWTFAAPRILLPPVRPTNGCRPRIEVEDVCMQRAEVRLPHEMVSGSSASDARLLAGVRHWVEERGLGRQVFVHAPSEPKPVYVDLASACAVDILRHLARHRADLRLVEMYPRRGGLWNRKDGPHSHVLEMRLLMVRNSSPGA